MKKILTKALVCSLMLACVLITGCFGKLSDKDAYNICKQYLNTIETLQNTAKSSEYEYALEEAQAIKEEVTDTDRSPINVLYSEYLDFDFNKSADPEEPSMNLFAPSSLYWMSTDVLCLFEDYFDCINEDEFKLNTSYKYYSEQYDRYEYFKVSIDDDKVYVYVKKDEGHIQYTINTNGTDWTSIERRSVSINSTGEKNSCNYFYLEKATNENRLFNRNSVVTWTMDSTADHKDQIRCYEVDEITQKMFFFDDSFAPENPDGVCKDLRDFMLTLNFEDFVNAVDVENAVAIN